MKPLTPIELAKELFVIHAHAEIVNAENPEQIVYREKDLIQLFKNLGYPEPDWDGYGKQCEKDLLSPPGETIIETLKHKQITFRTFVNMLRNSPERQQDNFWRVEILPDLLSGTMHIDDAIAGDLERVLGIDKRFWLYREKLYRKKEAKLKGNENV